MSDDPEIDSSRKRIGIGQGLARIPGPSGERFAELFQHGTLQVMFHGPEGGES